MQTQTKYQILDLLQKYEIPYAVKGKSFVCRCPWCKGDGRLQDHNAIINVENSTIYCFTEQKTYLVKDLLQLFGEIDPAQIEKAKEKIKSTAEHNTGLAKVTRERRKFDDVKNDLLRQGYTVTGIYSYFDLQGVEQYKVVRFEKPSVDGGKPEKKPIPVMPDGYVGLSQKRQIPYRLEQFSLFQTDEIWLTEGEKVADAVIASMPSSANIICLGFRKASDFKGYENLFKNKKVVVFEDNDKTGATNTQNLVEMLKPFARGITVVKFSEFRESYDVADFLQGFSWNQLLERIEISETITTPASQTSVIKIGTIEKVQKQEEWILEPFLPTNSIILLDGLGGAGKSIFTMEMAFAISTGQSFLLQDILPTGKYPILYMTAEETDWRFYERLQAIESAYDIKSENFYWISTISKDYTLSTSRLFCKKQNEVQPTETFVFLENAIQKIQPKLVVLDSWANFYGLDENSTEDGIYAYDCLKGLIRLYDCSFLLLHHQTKDAMKSLTPLFRGTMVFREQARARIVISKWNLPDRKKVAIEKCNYYSTKLIHFPILVSMSKGVWMIEAMAGEFEDFEEQEEEIENKKRKKQKKNGNNGKCINTVGNENDDFLDSLPVL